VASINRLVAGVKQTAGRRPRSLKLAALGMLLLATMVSGFIFWPHSPMDLAKGRHAEKSDLYSRWAAGDVVVLIRHGERCDESDHACVGPKDGITAHGQQVATQVGAAFTQLGMLNAQVMFSPLTRTVQTSAAMFPQVGQAQDWVGDCEHGVIDRIEAHKQAGHNLVLVTHSTCIAKVEAHLGLPHALLAEYSSALLLSQDADGKLELLGTVNPDDWEKVIAAMPLHLSKRTALCRWLCWSYVSGTSRGHGALA
jgi:phosphohistidine phosphatase SixA